MFLGGAHASPSNGTEHLIASGEADDHGKRHRNGGTVPAKPNAGPGRCASAKRRDDNDGEASAHSVARWRWGSALSLRCPNERALEVATDGCDQP